MIEKILFVDDDAIALEGFRLAVGGLFDATYALGAEQGERIVEREGPFAVIVSDLRMPGLSGDQFFSRVRQRHPETVRIMLTGVRDMDAAVTSVNVGEVYRFYTKPCKPEVLREALRDGMAKYRVNISFSTTIGSRRISDIYNKLQKKSVDASKDVLQIKLGFRLSPKELCVASFVCAGMSTKEIAKSLNISVRTVESHRENIRVKLHITDRKIKLQAYLASLLDSTPSGV